MAAAPEAIEEINAAVASLRRSAEELLDDYADDFPPALLDELIDSLGPAAASRWLYPELAVGLWETLAYALKLRAFQRLGQSGGTEDLERAIALYRRAIGSLPEGPDRYPLWANLAQALQARCIAVPQDPAAARETVTAQARAVDLAVREADLDYAAESIALLLRTTPAATDSVVLVRALRQAAVRAAPGDEAHRKIIDALITLSLRQIDRYDAEGSTVALDLAIEALEGAAEAVGASAHRVAAFGLLGSALGRRAEQDRAGADADLDAAVAALRIALDTAVAVDERDELLARLSTMLLHRFETGRQYRDLDEAIQLGYRVSAASGPPPARPGARTLERALRLRADLTGSSEDASIAHTLRWYLGRQEGPGARPSGTLKRLFGLGYSVLAAKRRAHTHPDLELAREADEEIAWLRSARAAAGDDRHRVELLEDLVDALSGRFTALPEAPLRDELIEQSRALVAELPGDQPAHRATHRFLLGMALVLRWRDTGRDTDLDDALEQLGRTAGEQASPTGSRLEAATLLGDTAAGAGRWTLATTAYEQAVDLLPRLAGRHLPPDDHLREVARWSGLASDAAAVAVRAGSPERALELLERGRGLLIGRVLEARDDFGDVLAAAPDRAPALLAELRRIGDELAAADPGHEDAPGSADRRRALVKAWDGTVASIRRLPGCAGFLAPVTIAELLPAAARGPVVTVNVSRFGSHALVLAGAGVAAVALPGLTPEAVHDRVTRFLDALPFAELSPADPEATGEAQQPLRDVLDWLAATVAAPVLAHLETPQRIWWIPTGRLAALPLHAVVLDQAVSSYAPTVRTLLRSPARSGDAPLVAVGATAGQTSLTGVTAEVDRLLQAVPGAVRIPAGEATRDRVRAALRTSRWLHVACHATSYPATPADSALHLDDGRLTVRSLLADQAPHGELVFLSACETVLSSEVAAAEVLHLGTAFHLAGFPHVIGTLWRVTDGTAAETARLFYGRTGSPPDAERAAVALHETARQLRDRYPGLPTRWAAYAHLGR
ncbi:CHAT domain-containing protein [Actinoplanes sp. M2I2]|uniref:CHAT domain-containing protein n=1 Tax=Actinoplanes sp. M2I2 TaxID=1734444 RepID=UPI0020223D8A|nr:CHAT domain-containing protein [Actinoplanes sp. M2I2]